MLFSEGYALQTILLWIIFFCSLLNLFLFAYWMPTVFTMIGMTPAQAIFASSLRDFGAIFVALYLGFAIDRVGPNAPWRALRRRRVLHCRDRAGVAALHDPVRISFLAGMTITGSQTGANGTCGKLYPARMRTSGLGWALGIGRLGAIVAPCWAAICSPSACRRHKSFSVGCVFALVAGLATALLAFRGVPIDATAGETTAGETTGSEEVATGT